MIDLFLMFEKGIRLFLINGIEHFEMINFLTFHFDHSVNIMLIGVIINVFHMF